MSLYHLMADIGAVPSKVIPKIPANAMKEEDQSIPRICVSRSLDECLTGITVTGITFPFLLEELRTSHTKQIWDKQYQFPFIVRTYCAENNNSAFFDEKKVSKYVWDANFTGECWLTEYREPISTKKRWLVNADIENRHIIRQFPVWSGTSVLLRYQNCRSVPWYLTNKQTATTFLPHGNGAVSHAL